MKEKKAQGGKVILVSFVISFILIIIPLPPTLQMVRPEFVTITLIYWCIALPNRVGIGIGWTSGIIIDVLTDTLLGQHALTLALIAYIASKLHQRIRVFPVWQQALTVLVLMSFQATIIMWIKGLLSESPSFTTIMLPAISSAIVWPAAFLLMRQVRRNYHIT